MRLLQWVVLVGVLGSHLFLSQSWSAEWSGYGADDLKIGKIARERVYPGGRDEEDLEVQALLIKPTRKEEAKKENTSTPASNDDEF